MNITTVSIPKAPGAGAPLPKRDKIYIFDADDIAADLVRSLGETDSPGELLLRSGAVGVFVQAVRSSISAGYENSGDTDARAFADRAEFDYPGDSVAFSDFLEAYANRGVVIIVESCDGPAKVYGRKCNPLRLSVEHTDSKDGRRTHCVFAQDFGDRWLPRIYGGAVPPVAKDSVAFWMSSAIWDGRELW